MGGFPPPKVLLTQPDFAKPFGCHIVLLAMASGNLNQQVLSATPILDGERPRPARPRKLSKRQILWIVASYTLLGIATVVIMLSGFEPAVRGLTVFVRFVDSVILRASSQPLGLGIRLIARWYCVVAVHELGHVVAGFLAGFTFYWVSIGPIRLASDGKRMRLHLQKLNWQGGFTAMLPSADKNSSDRWLFMVLGGAVANAVFACVLIFLAEVLQPDLTTGLRPLAIFSAVLALLSLAPIRHPRFVTDGSRILMLLRNPAKTARWLAIVDLQRAFISGKNYRDWDPQAVQTAASAPDKSPDNVNGTSLAYAYECHSGNLQQAAAYLEHLLESTPPEAIRTVLYAEATFFQGWHRRNLQRARLWWERGMRTRKKLPAYLRLREEATLLHIEGKYSEALEKLDEGLRTVRALPPLLEYSQLERDWLQWKDEMLARQREAQKSAHSAIAT